MKLNPLVASLCALGLTSFALTGSAFAAEGQELEAMKQKIAKMEALLDQNQGQAHSFSQLPLKNWQDRVTVSGLANVDLMWSSKIPSAGTAAATTGRFPLSSNGYSDVAVSNANLFVDAEMNCYTTAHIGLNYYGNTPRMNDIPRYNTNTAGAGRTFGVDEAYVTISNFAETPVYFRAGEQYLDFGTYDRFNITAPMTQQLSATNYPSLTLGVNTASGFNGSIYTFRGINTVAGAVVPAGSAVGKFSLNNGGLHLGYMGGASGMEYKLALDYISNWFDVNNVRAAMGAAGYTSRVGAWSAHGSMVYNQFDGAVDVVSAASRANVADFTYNAVGGTTTGAKPGAWGLDLGYSFSTSGLPSRVGLGYQHSWQALGIASALNGALPLNRWQAQYGVEIGRNTDLTLQVVNDKDYATTNTGTAVAGGGVLGAKAGSGRSSTTGILRLGVRFA